MDKYKGHPLDTATNVKVGYNGHRLRLGELQAAPEAIQKRNIAQKMAEIRRFTMES